MAIITNVGISTVTIENFRLYKVDITSLDGDPNANSLLWKKVRTTSSQSSSNMGVTYSYMLKDVASINRNYSLTNTGTTDLSKLMIEQNEFMRAFENADPDKTIFLYPDKVLKILLELVEATNFKVQMEDKYALFDSDFSYNPNAAKLLLGKITVLNPIRFFSYLYSGLGYYVFQEIPEVSLDDGTISGGIKLTIKNIMGLGEFEKKDNHGLIAMTSSLDYTKIPSFMTLGVGKDGEIVPANPWANGRDVNVSMLYTAMEKIADPLQQENMTMGDAKMISMYVPLFSFYENIDIRKKRNKTQNTNNTNTNTNNNTNNNKYQSADLKSLYKPDGKSKDKGKELFAGQKYLMDVLLSIADIKARMQYSATQMQVFGELEHGVLTDIGREIEKEIKIQKYQDNGNDVVGDFVEYGTIKITSGTLYVDSIDIKYEPTSEGPEAITTVRGFFIEDHEFKESMIKIKEDSKKKIDETIDKITDEDKSSEAQLNKEKVEEDMCYFDSYQYDDSFVKELLEETLHQSLEDNPVQSPPDGKNPDWWPL